MKSLLFATAVVLAPLLPMSDVNAGGGEPQLEFRLAVTAATDGFKKRLAAASDDVVYIAETRVASERDIERVAFAAGLEDGLHSIEFEFSDDASKKMFVATSANLGKRFAVLVDGQLLCALHINAPIKKRGVITGKFEDQDLVRLFRAIVLAGRDRQ